MRIDRQFSHAGSGFGLVELMIAMSLGLILSMTVVQVFIGARQTLDIQHRRAVMQEDARFALSRLASDIRMAGVLGCVRLDRLVPATAALIPVDFAVPVSHAGGVLTLITSMPVSETVSSPGTRRASQYGARWLIATDCLSDVRFAEGAPVNVMPGDVLIPVRKLEYRRSNASLQVRANGVGNYETLINGVAGFDLQFGLAATAGDASISGGYVRSVDRDEYQRIRSIRMQLTLSDNPAKPDAGLVAAQTHTLVATLRNRPD